jgi:hypothetical protein
MGGRQCHQKEQIPVCWLDMSIKIQAAFFANDDIATAHTSTAGGRHAS